MSLVTARHHSVRPRICLHSRTRSFRDASQGVLGSQLCSAPDSVTIVYAQTHVLESPPLLRYRLSSQAPRALELTQAYMSAVEVVMLHFSAQGNPCPSKCMHPTMHEHTT